MTDALGLREEVAEAALAGLRTGWRDENYSARSVACHLADALLPLIERLQAEAWDEGYRSGHSNAMRRMSDEPNAPTTPNPYRSPTMQHDTEGGAA